MKGVTNLLQKQSKTPHNHKKINETYDDSISIKGEKYKIKRGCSHCQDKHSCPDAFTGISQHCGNFDHTATFKIPTK